jgi:drug/metabolite transporter (DMT)-like permease
MPEFLPASPDTIAEAAAPALRPARQVARWKADLALVGNTFIWGTTFVLVKAALADISTLLFLALRFAVAGAALALLARGSAPLRRLLPASLIVGGSLFAGYLLQTWGLLFTTASKSAFITGFSVVLVPVLGALGYRRMAATAGRSHFAGPRLGSGPLLGVISSVIGLYLLTAPSGTAGINRGDLLTLGCAFAFALHILLIGHYSRLLPAGALAAGQVVVACGLALVAVPWAEPVRFRLSPALLLALLVTALLATALAFFVQTWAQQFTTPTHTALIFSMEPVFASLTSWVVAGERLGAAGWLGGFLILTGIVAAELLGSRRRD